MNSSDSGHTPVDDLLLKLSQRLLKAIDGQDWATYAELCDDTLTAFEPEAAGSLVAGMDFHEFYFRQEGVGRPHQSTISSPDVRILGDVAVICYVRLVQSVKHDGGYATSAFEETRVWHQQDGRWQHIHFHRSPAQ